MSILCDKDLMGLLGMGLIANPDHELVNPASIDIRIGNKALLEVGHGQWQEVDLTAGRMVMPGDFLLVETLETFNVPNGYAMDLRLKSSTARRGWDHSLAFWVDPGWQGVLTMEVRNVLRYNGLMLCTGERFAQAIVHKLTGPSLRPYQGRYHGATGVERAKQ